MLNPIIVTFLFFGSIASFAQTAAKKIAPRSTITCEQFNGEEEHTKIAQVIINLDQKGQAYNIMVMKLGTKEVARRNASLNIQNATITHTVQPNKVDEIDEETNEPIYAWGIKEVEVIEANGKKGESFKLSINDHSYAGSVGSTLSYNLGGIQGSNESDGTFVFCNGHLKFPSKR